MKQLYILLSLLSWAGISNAQELHIEWTKFIGSNGTCPAQVRFTIPTSDGGVLFTGVTTCDDKGDIPPFPIPGTNVFVGKMDSNMQLSWIKMIGGEESDIGRTLCEFPDGGYGLGISTSSSEFPNFHDGNDILLTKLDGQGNVVFQKCYGGPASDEVLSILPSPEGGFVVFGISADSGGDVPLHYGNTQFWFDWWVFKTDSGGDILWNKIYGGTDEEGFFGTVLAVDTNYYIFGSSNSKDIDCVDTNWHSSTVNTGDDLFLLKLNNSGDLTWSKSYGGSGYELAGAALFDERDSSIIITGESQSYDYMSAGNHGGQDAIVVKTSLDGTVIWDYMAGTGSNERGESICKVTAGGYLILGNTNLGTVGAQDCWLSYIDSNGASLTSKVFGSTINDNPASIFSYKGKFMAAGSAGKPLFSEGQNMGHQGEGPASFSFFSYINFWAAGIDSRAIGKYKLEIHPNPSEGKVSIKVPGEGKSYISIADVTGKIVFSQHLENTAFVGVSTVGWATGTYIVSWHDQGGARATTKLIIP